MKYTIIDNTEIMMSKNSVSLFERTKKEISKNLDILNENFEPLKIEWDEILKHLELVNHLKDIKPKYIVMLACTDIVESIVEIEQNEECFFYYTNFCGYKGADINEYGHYNGEDAILIQIKNNITQEEHWFEADRTSLELNYAEDWDIDIYDETVSTVEELESMLNEKFGLNLSNTLYFTHV